MIRSEVRKICAEMIEEGQSPRGELTNYFARQAGRGGALAVILPEVLDELERLEAAIRNHRDQTDDRRCWQDDDELYAALPEGATVKADTSLPPEPEFLESCARHCRQFWRNRQRPQDRDRTLAPREMTIAQLEAEVDGYREVCQEHLRQIEIYRTTRDEVRDEVHRLEAERDAFRRAVERTERGQTKPYRLGRLAALLCDLIAADYAGRSADPRSMTMVLRDVADLYRGLVLACDPGNDGVYFPGLPPLGDDEGWPLMGLGVAGNAADDERKSG
jgi:hypothetical protein